MGDNLPLSIDWRARGAVAPVRLQKGSFCWAYATIAAVESIYHISTEAEAGLFKRLSIQYLIDCYDKYKKDSHMGNAQSALEFIIRKGGNLFTEDEYPLNGKGTKDDCASEGRTHGTPTAHIDDLGVCKKNEKKLQRIVSLQPVIAVTSSSALVRASINKKDIIMYKDLEKDKKKDVLDHCVLIVGYGSEDGVDYWLCQNFWGLIYRENGYFRVERNVEDRGGTAGIARKCCYPVIRDHGAALLEEDDAVS